MVGGLISGPLLASITCGVAKNASITSGVAKNGPCSTGGRRINCRTPWGQYSVLFAKIWWPGKRGQLALKSVVGGLIAGPLGASIPCCLLKSGGPGNEGKWL